MGKISNYTRALVAKLQDVFVVDQTDNNVTATKSVTVEQIGDTIAGTQVHSTLTTSDKTLIGAIKEVAKDKNVADEYDATQTYNKGDVVIYKNTLYICNTNNTTGTFDPSKWTATTIDDLIPKTDNNLPHYTGTPTAGSTAEAIDDLKTEAVTFTPSTGITLNYSSIGKTDKQVGGSIICKYSSFAVGTWKELGYISAPPTDDIKTCSANNTTGQFAGMVRFETNGKVSVYPQQSGEYAVAFSFAYITA